MRIYLVGYMASGKSRLGQDLAAGLEYEFLDLDDIFEERFHISILDFFDKYGETHFRQIEQRLLFETVSLKNTVIATGGGTPCFLDNMSFIRDHGLSVYLYWPAEALAERLIQVRKKRPLIKNLAPGEMDEFIQKHLKEREVFYRQADILFDMKQKDLFSLINRIRIQESIDDSSF